MAAAVSAGARVSGGQGGAEAAGDELFLGGAGGEEAAGVLEGAAGAEGEVGIGGVGEAEEVAVVEVHKVRRVAQPGGELIGHAAGAGQPEGVRGEVVGGGKVGGELTHARVEDKAGVAGCEMGGDGGVALLVANNVAHGRQAAGDGVEAIRDGLAEGERAEGGHGGGRREK